MDDPLLGNDRRYVFIRRYVECGIKYLHAFRRRPFAEAFRDLLRVAFLDRNLITDRRIQVDGRQRTSHVERDVMRFGKNGNAVGADFVGDITVRRDAVGSDDDSIDPAFAHDHAGHIVADQRHVNAACCSSNAVSRAPCRTGRVSSANTRSFDALLLGEIEGRKRRAVFGRRKSAGVTVS